MNISFEGSDTRKQGTRDAHPGGIVSGIAP